MDFFSKEPERDLFQEGIFLDPVCTGKAFAGLLELSAAGTFTPETNVLFLHTGGTGGIFAVQ